MPATFDPLSTIRVGFERHRWRCDQPSFGLPGLLQINSANYRPHTTVKNARIMKSVSQAKLLYFEGIFKL